MEHEHPTCHRWELSPKEARVLQKRLAAHVVPTARLGSVSSVTGVDVSYRDGLAKAAAVVLSYPNLELVDCAVVTRTIDFPYVAGLLSFREGPVIIAVLEKLTVTPELLILDGHGLAHPRRFGLASHIGLLVDLPSIGCAKTRLCGTYAEPGPERGDFTFLTDQGETIGAVVRTRSRVKPVFVSVGHRVDLMTSISYVLKCCRGYRLPETTRRADRLAAGKIPPELAGTTI